MVEYSFSSKEFHQALKDDALIGSQCKVCSAFSIPQRQICPKCHATETEIVTYSGKGILKAFTVIFVPPVMMAQAGHDAKNPYCVGIVELDEGPRISAQVLDVDLMHPENIAIGTRLEMTTLRRGEGENEKAFLAFRPV